MINMNVSISRSLIDKYLSLSILFFTVFLYLFPKNDQFLLRVLPIVFGFSIYFLFFGGAFKKLKGKDVFIVCAMMLLVLWMVLRVFFECGFSGLFSSEILYFLYWPFMFVSIYRFVARQEFLFLNAVFVLFLGLEFIVVLGQVCNSLFGVGLYHLADYSDLSPSEKIVYGKMLSGTFVNSNDLASAVVLSLCYFYVVRDRCSVYFNVAMILGFVLLVLAASRSMLILFFIMSFYFVARSSVIIFIGFSFLISGVMVVLYFLGLYFVEYDSIQRIMSRIDSVFLIIERGLMLDYSVYLRLTSYSYFFDNFFDVGLGSGEFKNYSYFFRELSGDFLLFAKSPHAFFFEVGYWLGYPGFVTIVALFIMFCVRTLSLDSVFVLFVFFVVSFVSSSIIGKFFIIYAFFACILCIKRGFNYTSRLAMS